MRFFIGQILPFITLSVFLAGCSYRLVYGAKTPKIKMTLTPAPPTDASRRCYLIGDYFLFRRYFAANRPLWLLGWSFHFVLFFIFLGHLRVFFDFFDRLAIWFGFSINQIESVTHVLGMTAGVLLFVIVLLLFTQRICIKRIREISTTSDFLILFLLFATVITGTGMRFLTAPELMEIRIYFKDLFSLTYTTVPENLWFVWHYLLGQILIIMIPFSKLFHFGGLYFNSALLYRK
jgi:nitrate reductase gamma subunit